MHKRILPLLWAALILPALSAGCNQAQTEFRVAYWAAPDGAYPAESEVELNDPGVPGFDRAADRIQLTAALNETVAFRLWVSYSGAIDREISLVVDDWRSGTATLARGAVTIFRAHAVRVPRWRGWHICSVAPDRRREWVEDVLIPAAAPRGGLPCKMSDGDTLSLWVDVSVPKGTAPGVFRSKLRVRCAGETAATVDLRLKVLPFVLPEQTDVVLAADVDHAALFAHHVTYQGRSCRARRLMTDSPIRAELQAVLDSTVRLLHVHKVAPLLNTLYPIVKIDALNELSVRWEDYDLAVQGYLDGTKFIDRTALPLWVVPFDERFPTPPAYGAMQSPSYSRHLRRYLACCAEHFAERGWLARSFVEIPYAESPSLQAVEASEHFARVIRKADTRLRILSNLFPQDLEPYGWPDFPTGDLAGYVDVYCPPAQFYAPPPPIGGVPPARMWMQLDRPPFSGSIELGASLADTRVIPWQARREGAAVVRLGAINQWPEVTEGLTAQACIDPAEGKPDAETPLIYPGSIAGLTEPIPSVRLKRLRRGMQDLAYLKLMREKGIGHIADVLTASLARFAGAKAYRFHYADTRAGGWVRDPRWWREAGQIMVDELTRVLGQGSGEQREWIAANVRWQRFIAAVRQVRMEVESVRVRRVAPAALGGAAIECTLAIHNGERAPVSGSLDFGELPVGWTGLANPFAVSVSPGATARVVLTAEAAVVTWNDDGVRYLPIEFSAGGSPGAPQYEIAARMSYVAAQPLYDGIRIDGDLSDWPPSVGNLASGFLLIAGEPLPPGGDSRDESRRATSQTRVYVAADTQALYFAFDCATGSAAPVLPAHSNVVEYDDWVPLGDELVEIVLDPTGAGTHSPGDLYHVVIKPSGALWERGVLPYAGAGAPTPAGRRRVWAADIRHAARTYPDHWVAELRIPLEAFDDVPPSQRTGGPIWAVNFSRFDRQHQEYSNWSGATRNFYDPASLGNLALP